MVPQTKPGGVPHRLLEVFLKIYEVLGGLGRFGRMLRAVLHGYGRFSRALERLLDGLQRGVGRSWRGFGWSKRAAKPISYRKKCCSKSQKVPKQFFDGFCVEDKQSWRPQNLYLSLGILMPNAYLRFQHRHNFLFLLGANMAPFWHSKWPKIVVWRVSGRLLGALGKLQKVLRKLWSTLLLARGVRC